MKITRLWTKYANGTVNTNTIDVAKTLRQAHISESEAEKKMSDTVKITRGYLAMSKAEQIKVAPAVRINKKRGTMIIALIDIDKNLPVEKVELPIVAVPDLQGHITRAYGEAFAPDNKMIEPAKIMPGLN